MYGLLLEIHGKSSQISNNGDLHFTVHTNGVVVCFSLCISYVLLAN